MKYSNFKNFYGLLRRMLLSGDKVAYFILFRELISLLVTPFDFIFLWFQKRMLKKAPKSSKPILLVIGGSRNGTTLLYQYLTAFLPVSYINNLYAIFERAPIVAYKLFHRWLPKPPKSFRSYFGNARGLRGPNDGFSLWNRWFGSNRNFIDSWPDDGEILEMKQFFNAWHQVAKKPFLNKNNRNSLSAPLLHSIFDNAFFIEIHRDPVYVAQSLALSRKAVQGDEKIGWGLLGRDTLDKNDPMAYLRDICEQVYEVDQLLAKGRLEIDPKKYFRISYETFCQNPAKIIQEISRITLNHELQANQLTDLKPLVSANRQKLEDKEFELIKSHIKRLYARKEQQGLKKKYENHRI